MEKEIAVKIEHVSKTFRIPHEKVSSVRGAVVSMFRQSTYEEFQALDDVSFEVKKGEFFGIIGRNGSGKSTLLKVLAGIYQPDAGKVAIDGMISPFLELGIGFNPELSGRDNVYLNATVLGMTKKEIDQKFDDIVAFSELERFIDQKLKNYSSGMQVRLAFAVSIHANRDILLMDEVLAVGDSNFQAKCLEQFMRYKEQGKTVILVGHDIGTLQRYCTKLALLRDGKLVAIGKPKEVIDDYIQQNILDEEDRQTEDVTTEEAQHESLNSGVDIPQVEFLGSDGKPKKVFSDAEDIVARIHYKTEQVIKNPVFGLAIYSHDDVHLCGPNTQTSDFPIESIQGEGHIDFILKENRLFTGNYLMTVAIFNNECTRSYVFIDKGFIFKVISHEKNQMGLLRMDIQWKK